MKFKIDENLPLEVAVLLRSANHQAITIHEQQMTGEADPRIIEVCQQEERALVTLDLDFANVRAYPPKQFHSNLVLRLHRQDKPHVLTAFRRALPLMQEQPVNRHLWIIEETRIRVWGEDTD
ncbi:MAG: hypothetical protein CVU38_14320 [Chloroflexi bacterium HGW-Chloroflexi-1]|nr:MAG: hypothetical protein CVU38_14320 [Chloroflexi bacterium HGW-Chloroflexi-1]